MAKITVATGILLIILGVVGYMGSEPGNGDAKGSATEQASTSESGDVESNDNKEGKKSVTALIPAFVGALLTFFGLLALKDSLRKLAMHIAVAIGLLGFLAGAGRGAMGIGKFLSGDPSLNQRSFLFVWLMAIICGIFVFLCVQSFIAARKQQQQAPSETAN